MDLAPMSASGTALHSYYEPRLIALSFLVAITASYVALSAAERLAENRGRGRFLWVAGGAIALGTGVWSMHFIGMLAFRLPIGVRYDLPTVVVSLLLAIVASAIALLVVGGRALTVRRFLLGGLVIGAGICSMHYVGMAAMRLDAMMVWNPAIVALSIAVAVVVSWVALWLLFTLREVSASRSRRGWRRLFAAVVMGFAIAGMHYTGMAAARFVETGPLPAPGITVEASAMGAGAVALAALLVLAATLAVAFVDRRFSASRRALDESKRHVRMVVANAPVILFSLADDGTITMAQGRGLAAIGADPSAIVGRSFFTVFLDLPAVCDAARRALGGEEHNCVATLGDVVLEMRWTPLREDDGRGAGAIAVATDITERRRVETELEHQASHDPLTGLLNRTALRRRLDDALRDGAALALAVIDLDRFKDVNDSLGHAAGDALLCEVAARIETALDRHEFAARLGGDEFALVLPEADDQRARTAARRVIEALAMPCAIEEHRIEVGATIGIALAPAHGRDAEALLREADVAMYVGKRDGTSLVVYDPSHDRSNAERLTLQRELRGAIERDELVLVYQPKVDLVAERIDAVEALVRWEHPTRGTLLPETFIPIAEESGLINPLTHRVLGAALRQLRSWEDDGLVLDVAVNLSMRSIHDPDLIETILDALKHHELAAKRLTLEVTESSLIADLDQALLVLGALAAIGVTIAIDDFGTGYSSLAHLKGLPVGEIKIDKSFVIGMRENVKDAEIVRLVSGLGRSLGLRIVAEGVENAALYDDMRRLGCDAVQGYYVAHALTADAMRAWLGASRWRTNEQRAERT
jgi:diguanylate cyclase